MQRLRILVSVVLAWGWGLGTHAADPAPIPVGVSRMDVSPSYRVRLTGYAARTNLSEGVAQHLWAKALAFGSDQDGPRILVTVDNCGVPANVVEEVAGRLALKARVRREDFAVASSHTHSGPMIRGFAENIFVRDLTPEESVASDRYTSEITDKLEAVALDALHQRHPGRLFFGEGMVGFAENRRTPGGPVEHALPVLVARDLEGRTMAVVANYACHCTTLGHQVNQAHGDWAGYAQEGIEADHPGAVAMITIGCGADANPSPRGGDDFGVGFARQHGRALATEVKRLVEGALIPLPEMPKSDYRRLLLPFQALPTRAEWEKRAQEPGIVGYHARKNLDRLDRGQSLPTSLPYFVQTWTFDRRLAMVFLAGEVVVDYARRLKGEFDAERLWITAYANDVPCYIPSRRILGEGGYEAETSLWYYDRPARLAPEVEDLIHHAATNLLPANLRVEPGHAEFPGARAPEDALFAFQSRPGVRIELVAAEPLIESPVAIDFGVDGRLWVGEMRDYPSGMDGQGQPGGRVKVLRDLDGDGRPDQSKVVAIELPFPTGLMAWREGVLVCAAPDVLFIPESDTPIQGVHDPRARRLLTGFATHNFQARVNGLRWGFDGWVYGSGGIFGGPVTSLLSGRETDSSGRDFRFHPDTGEFESLAGVSQQGRVRDDFGQWFGNDNSTLLWHYPLPDAYSRRNPHVAPPAPRQLMNRDDGRVFPASRTLARFNDPEMANRLTSVCGPEIYRDDLLGPGFTGNAFVCEPVHNLIRRAIVEPDGPTFAAHRAPDESHGEFLASRDNWFRPVEVRTGPDGALWVVDMYRFVIEHPRWIPPERLRQLDVRAGAERGRIYRVLPSSRGSRPVRNLASLSPSDLAEAMDTPNGVVRDLIQRLIVEHHASPSSNKLANEERRTATGQDRVQGASPNRDRSSKATSDLTDELISLAKEGHPPEARIQALYTLAQTGTLPDALLGVALKDADGRVVRAALPLVEGREALLPALSQLTQRSDGVSRDAGVVFQLCLSLGAFSNPEAIQALKHLAWTRSRPWLRAAWLTSCAHDPGELLEACGSLSNPAEGTLEIFEGLLQTVAGAGRLQDMAQWLKALMPASHTAVNEHTLWAALRLRLILLQQAGLRASLAEGQGPDAEIRRALERLEGEVTGFALERLRRGEITTFPEATTPPAIAILGELARSNHTSQGELIALLDSPVALHFVEPLRAAVKRQEDPEFARRLMASWARWTPSTRSLVLGALADRDSNVDVILAAVERGDLRAVELEASLRQRLLHQARADLRARAVSVLALPTGNRADVVAAYASAADLKGDPSRGGGHFDRICATCHAVRGHGHAVGPDLAPFAAKPPEDFLLAILNPNAAVDPRFLGYEIELAGGRELSGVVSGETANSITVTQAGGVQETLLRRDLLRLTPQTLSLMPEGLEQGLQPQDFADLIAWLKTGPARFGSATAEQALVARRRLNADGVSRLSALESNSPALEYGSWLGTRRMHFCRQSDGRSEVDWRGAPATLERSNAGHRLYRFPAAMGFVSQPKGDFELKVNGASAVRFDVALDDAGWSDANGRVHLRYTVMERNEEDSNGVMEIELPDDERGAEVQFVVIGSAAGSQRWFGLYETADVRE